MSALARTIIQRHGLRFLTLTLVPTVLLCHLGSDAYSQDQPIQAVLQCPSIAANTFRCEIYKPEVTQRLTNYGAIGFLPGDFITVEASGCVQTGGWGLTWKRYVDPRGPDSDKYYHGLIWIPGVLDHPVGSGPIRISTVIGKLLQIDPTLDPKTPGLFLRLGYEDEEDEYDNNGYWGHDDGTEDQCKNVGPADVVITIFRGRSAKPIQAIITGLPNPPMDLEWKQRDPNLLPRNPTWAYADQNKNQPPDPIALCNGDVLSPTCTSQSPTVDEYEDGTPWLCQSDYPINGHANWIPAVYEGNIVFEGYDAPPGDADYNWDLTPIVPNAGLTSYNDGGALHLEFDSDETIDNFYESWWKQFHTAVDSDVDKAKQMVENRRAVVSGLVGLDMVHSPWTEVHPVYAFAVETSTAPSDTSWAIFVRNFGDEGQCSTSEHYLDLPAASYTIRLPWPKNSLNLRIVSMDLKTSAAHPVNVFQPVVSGFPIPVPFPPPWENSGSVEISFQFPEPEDRAWIEGEVHLAWDQPVQPQKGGIQPTPSGPCTSCVPGVTEGVQQGAVRPPSPTAKPLILTTLGQHFRSGEPEAKLFMAYNLLTPEQKQTFNSYFYSHSHPHKPTAASVTAAAVPAKPVEIPAKVLRMRAPIASKPPTVRQVRDPWLANRVKVQRGAFCAAVGNKPTKLGDVQLDCLPERIPK
jgi:hypothetical protein